MRLLDKLRSVRLLFQSLTFYQQFEYAIVLVLTVLIVGVVTSATWHLSLTVLALLLTEGVDPADQHVFQSVFGMVFTVIIALEFKHSLLVVLAGQESIVRVRSIILIAMLAVSRKFIILDLKDGEASSLFALAAAILALGIVYWLVRDQDRRTAANVLQDEGEPLKDGQP